jgi:hypothetical protein
VRVPVLLFGSLKLTTTNDLIGNLGKSESETVFVRFPFLGNFGYYLLWIILLPFLILKSNRNRAVWVIPLLAVVFHVALLFLQGIDPYRILRIFTLLCFPLATGMGLVWLIGGALKPERRVSNSALMTACLILVAFLGRAFCYGFNSTGLQYQLVPMAALYLFTGLVLVLGAAIAAKACKKPVKRMRFLSWLLLWDVVLFFLCFVLVLIVFKTTKLLGEEFNQYFFRSYIKPMLLFGAAAGFVIFIIQMPFILLGAISPFFRERFRILYGVEAAKSETKKK